MKKFILTLVSTTFASIAMIAQPTSEHLTFKGVPIDGTSLECHVSISARGVISEKVVDLVSGDEYTLHRVANATGSFVGQVRAEVTSLLKRIAVSCFERNVFIRNQSRELLETVRSRWNEEL